MMWIHVDVKIASKFLAVSILMTVLVLSAVSTTNVSATVGPPEVVSVLRDGNPISSWTTPPYDPTTGKLGPIIVDQPPPGLTDGPHNYVITIQWSGSFDPVVVGGFADLPSSGYFWDATAYGLTITAKSVAYVSGGITYYILGVQVFFSSTQPGYQITSQLSENNGAMTCFQADPQTFKIQEGPEPGILQITLSNYPGQTYGFFKLFIPASVPAQFGRTLNDVRITIDGTAVVGAVATDTSGIVSKACAGVPGRLWVFTVTYSTRTILSDPDPTVLKPVAGELVPMNKFSILAPYLIMIGLVGIASAVFAIKIKRKP